MVEIPFALLFAVAVALILGGVGILLALWLGAQRREPPPDYRPPWTVTITVSNRE